VCKGLLGRAPGAVLALKDVADASAALGVITLAGCLLGQPLGKFRGSRIELLNFGGSGKIIGEKARSMRDFGVRETLGLHRQHSRDGRTVRVIVRNRSHSLPGGTVMRLLDVRGGCKLVGGWRRSYLSK